MKEGNNWNIWKTPFQVLDRWGACSTIVRILDLSNKINNNKRTIDIGALKTIIVPRLVPTDIWKGWYRSWISYDISLDDSLLDLSP